MRVTFWGVEDDGQKCRGSVWLKHGVAHADTDAAKRAIGVPIADHEVGEYIRIEDDPERFLRALPRAYDGSRFYAQLEDEGTNGHARNGVHYAKPKVTDADFRYRGAEDADVRCGRCRFYEGGKCAFFANLRETVGADVPSVVGADMVCDAFQEASKTLEYQDDFLELARWHAEMLNDHFDATQLLDVERYQAATAELEGSPWTIDFDADAATWRVASKAHDFATTQLDVPKEIAGILADLAGDVAETDLAKPLDDAFHVTVLYGLHGQDPEPISRIVESFGVVRLKLGRFYYFSTAEHDVLHVAVESSQLRDLHRLLARLPHTDSHPDYVPHLTLAYVKPGCGKAYSEKDNILDGLEFDADELTFSAADGLRATCSMDGSLRYERVGGALHYGGKRCPAGYTKEKPLVISGKPFVGGQWIPGEYLNQMSPEQKAQVDAGDKESQGQRQEKQAAWRKTPVDVGKFKERVGQHKGEIDDEKMQKAKGFFKLLRGHHQNYILHRLEEIAEQTERGLAYNKKLLESNPPNRRDVQGRVERHKATLGRVAHMLDWMGDHGYAHPEEEKPAPKEEKPEVSASTQAMKQKIAGNPALAATAKQVGWYADGKMAMELTAQDKEAMSDLPEGGTPVNVAALVANAFKGAVFSNNSKEEGLDPEQVALVKERFPDAVFHQSKTPGGPAVAASGGRPVAVLTPKAEEKADPDIKTMTVGQMLNDNEGATADQWMKLRAEADAAGRIDLVKAASDQAEKAYEAADEASSEEEYHKEKEEAESRQKEADETLRRAAQEKQAPKEEEVSVEATPENIERALGSSLGRSAKTWADKNVPLEDRLHRLADIDTQVLDDLYNKGLLKPEDGFTNNELLRTLEIYQTSGSSSPDSSSQRMHDRLGKAAVALRRMADEGAGGMSPDKLRVAASYYGTLGREAVNEYRKENGLSELKEPAKEQAKAAAAPANEAAPKFDDLQQAWEDWAPLNGGVQPTASQYDVMAERMPGLTPEKWKSFLEKAWDDGALEMHVLNEVREAGDKWKETAIHKDDKMYGYVHLKDPAKMRQIAEKMFSKPPESAEPAAEAPAEAAPAKTTKKPRAKRQTKRKESSERTRFGRETPGQKAARPPMTREQAIAAMVNYNAKSDDADPRKTASFNLAPHEATASTVEKAISEQKQSNPFQRLSIGDISKQFPDIDIDTLHGVLGKMHKEGRIRLAPWTLAPSEAKEPEKMLPLDRENKWYLELK